MLHPISLWRRLKNNQYEGKRKVFFGNGRKPRNNDIEQRFLTPLSIDSKNFSPVYLFRQT